MAEQTWQDIWLASGEQPEACLATFIEILIFKFLSDLGVLSVNPSGLAVDFKTVIGKRTDVVLRYYFETVRPEIRRLFPPGPDGTSVINGIVFDANSPDQGRLFLQILRRFQDFGSLKKIDPEFKSRIFERFLKKSLSVKNWGQYFTPRNVVKAMVEMSGVEYLPPEAVVADPACGVGGFVLEPLMNKRLHGLQDFWKPTIFDMSVGIVTTKRSSWRRPTCSFTSQKLWSKIPSARFPKLRRRSMPRLSPIAV